MEKIAWRQALPTGLADALVWVWFLQTAYLSRFTEQITTAYGLYRDLPYLPIALCIGLNAAIVLLRWDRVPAAFRIACAVADCLAPAAVLACGALGAGDLPAAFGLYLVLLAASYGSQVLRVETLAKCPNLRTLAMALLVSFVLYYALSAVLLVVPLAAYNTLVLAAPAAFLYRTFRPLAPQENPPAGWRRSFANVPTALLVLFGIAGGLISAHGGSNPALYLTSLFSTPDPFHLVMVLANLGLSIMAASLVGAPRGAYYAFISIVWMGGSLIGVAVFGLLPPLPAPVFLVAAGAIAVAIIASFVVDRRLWLGERAPAAPPREEPHTPPEPDPVEGLSHAGGLTPRETEILRLLAEGRSVPVICERLVISEGTARTHVKHIYQKLDVHNRQELLDLVESPSGADDHRAL